MRYHVSADGVSRECKAQTQEACRATSSDGGPAPHGEFNTPEEARRFAEEINENQYDPWSTNSRGGYYADGVGADEEAIAARSEAVITGADLTIEEDEIDSEGRLSELSRDSTIRFVRDDDPRNSRPSGYPAWKIYGSEKDLAEFMGEDEGEEFVYGQRDGEWGPSMPITIAPAKKPNAVEDRKLPSEPGDGMSHEIKGGRYINNGKDYGEIREVSKDEVDSWADENTLDGADFRDGDVAITDLYDPQEPQYYMRLGDKYYGAGWEA